MSPPGRTIRLTIELTYDAESMHGDDPDARKWFKDMLHGDDLQLADFGELGDMIGKVRVVPDLCNPTQDERVRALVDALHGEATHRLNGHPHRPDMPKVYAALAALRDTDK